MALETIAHARYLPARKAVEVCCARFFPDLRLQKLPTQANGSASCLPAGKLITEACVPGVVNNGKAQICPVDQQLKMSMERHHSHLRCQDLRQDM